VLWWLAQVNLILVIFNAIPGYPLDGGRVLRALLWMWNGNLRKATYITSRIGIGFSFFLIILGIFTLFAGAWNGFVLILIGIFLKNAAESGYSQTLFKEVLGEVKVRQLMTPNPVSIPARLPLNLVVDDYFLTNHHVAFPVVDDDGRFRGLLRLEFLKNIPREKWPFTLAGEIADTPEGRNLRLQGDADAAETLQTLLTPGRGRMGVIDREGKLTGIVTRHDLLHYIRVHHELE
jgi:CBS domain-containing protein